jgi:excisionase family DNA binding protein
MCGRAQNPGAAGAGIGVAVRTRMGDSAAMSDTQSSQPEPNGRGHALSVSEAAAQLGVSVDTVRAHLRQGTLPGEKLGNRWVVHLAEPALPTPSHPADSDQIVAEGPTWSSAQGAQPYPPLRRAARRVGAIWRRARGLATRA